MNVKSLIITLTSLLTLIGAYVAVAQYLPVSAKSHIADVNALSCKLAWIEYESVKRKVDNADHRAAENDTERNRTDVTKYNVDLVKALKEIEKVC
tara:strand:+ start:40 stop:324 length:285 start_codon:yes stop_codon:yes gene_type:complete